MLHIQRLRRFMPSALAGWLGHFSATFVCRSDFLGLFGALLGSGFGAVVLAAVLGELPAFDF